MVTGAHAGLHSSGEDAGASHDGGGGSGAAGLLPGTERGRRPQRCQDHHETAAEHDSPGSR